MNRKKYLHRNRMYSKHAHSYDSVMEIIGYPAALKGILNNISMDLSYESKILDLGCGTGLATVPLAKRFPKAEITGLDCSEEMIEEYKLNFPEAKAIVGDFNGEGILKRYSDGKPIIFPDDYFDIAVSTGALSEYGKPERAIPFVYSKLKKGGLLINIGVNDTILSKLTGVIWGYTATSKRRFAKACIDAEFKEVKYLKIPAKFFPNNFWRYAIIAKK